MPNTGKDKTKPPDLKYHYVSTQKNLKEKRGNDKNAKGFTSKARSVEIV